MSYSWRVTHKLRRGVEVKDSIEAYPRLGLKLNYEGDKLISVEHVFEVGDKIPRWDAVRLSEEVLGLFWVVVRYWRGFPLEFEAQTAEELGASEQPGTQTAFVSSSVSAAIAHRIRMPTEELLIDPPERLRIWLTLANEAREATSDTDAIRNYAVIWEDLHGWSNEDSSESAVHLKYTRNFVSHPEVGDPKIKAWLTEELGRQVNKYDPTDSTHRRLIRQQRQAARSLIERELEGRLGDENIETR